jgi:tetratricopeptide (TPR) repeat protein
LAIFPGSAFVHSLRGNLFAEAGSLRDAEREYLLSASLEPNGTSWSSLGALYHRQGRLLEEIDAWELASALLPYPAAELLALGFAELAAHRPQEGVTSIRQGGCQPAAEARTTGQSTFLVAWHTGGQWLAVARSTALNAVFSRRSGFPPAG